MSTTRSIGAWMRGNLWASLLPGALLAAGATTAAVVLGGLLLAARALVTANLCLPCETFASLERRRAPARPITT